VRKTLKMLMFCVGAVAIKWDKHCVNLRRNCLEDLHRIISGWKNTTRSYKLSVMCLLVLDSRNAAVLVVSR
jgi:hypothetical protein